MTGNDESVAKDRETGKEARGARILIYLYRYLYANTDEAHPVSFKDLKLEIEKEFGPLNRKSLTSYLSLLTDSGYDIISDRERSAKVYYMGRRELELPDLKLLMDAVSSARFMTQETSAELLDKLKAFCSVHEARQLTRHIYTAEKLKADKKHFQKLTYLIDDITDSINGGYKLSFQYLDYDKKGNRILKHNGYTYIVSPYALVWDNNHYYMVGWSDKADHRKIIHFRVDRMYNPQKLQDQKAHAMPKRFDIDSYIRKRFMMYDGEEMSVTLVCDPSVMKDVIDHFGEDVTILKSEDKTFTAKALAADAPPFYSWLFGYTGKIRLKSPEKAVQKYLEMTDQVIRNHQ